MAPLEKSSLTFKTNWLVYLFKSLAESFACQTDLQGKFRTVIEGSSPKNGPLVCCAGWPLSPSRHRLLCAGGRQAGRLIERNANCIRRASSLLSISPFYAEFYSILVESSVYFGRKLGNTASTHKHSTGGVSLSSSLDCSRCFRFRCR